MRHQLWYRITKDHSVPPYNRRIQYLVVRLRVQIFVLDWVEEGYKLLPKESFLPLFPIYNGDGVQHRTQKSQRSRRLELQLLNLFFVFPFFLTAST